MPIKYHFSKTEKHCNSIPTEMIPAFVQRGTNATSAVTVAVKNIVPPLATRRALVVTIIQPWMLRQFKILLSVT